MTETAAIKSAGKALVAGAKDDIDAALTRYLETDTPEVRQQAQNLIELAADVASARLAGTDTVVAEQAIKVAYYSLASATSTATALAVVGLAQDLIRRAATSVVAIIAAL